MEVGKTWREVRRIAVDRIRKKRFIDALAPEGATGIIQTDRFSHSVCQPFVSRLLTGRPIVNSLNGWSAEL
jgi:hypothetical protein